MDFSLTSKVQTDLLNMCRICLHKIETEHSPSEKTNNVELLNKIYICFEIKLTLGKYLPSLICEQCVTEINIAYNFRLKCIAVDDKLYSYYKTFLKSDTNYKNDSCNEEQNSSWVIKETQEAICKNSPKCSEIGLNGKEVKDFGNLLPSCTYPNKILKSESLLNKPQILSNKTNTKRTVRGIGANRRYYCTECPYSTPHSQTLVNHMRRHNGDRPYQCKCGKSFTQSSSLSAHLKTHSTTTYFTCSTCGKQFKHAFSLKKHLNVHNLGQFSCEICYKQLKSRQSLNDHMYRHYNIRNYNCEDCGDTFITSSELFNHKKKHVDERKVECHACGYTTRHKRNLIIHLKRHAGEKLFKCITCVASFYTSGDLQRHMRVHTRDKPFPCPTCKQKFAHSTSLNKHMHTIHGIDYKWADLKLLESRKEKPP
ncbi:zinc finger protein 26 [Danaus plexippus plexippus]|uniref:Zinc finger protein 26 n=1 Tax=Danaus plexippus plexippus TaxID=278856 RepID=A0A212F100_DANPL|nr:zinc finger protein 26 [Danaus plexippus plexippus]